MGMKKPEKIMKILLKEFKPYAKPTVRKTPGTRIT